MGCGYKCNKEDGLNTMNKVFALVDCNNFFASCERVFDPKLCRVPVVILSNNDGCIIARSNEAKALGIPMGAPFYQYKKLIEEKKVRVFSSNYQLYGDMSHRVMQSLKIFCKNVEVYSIDEAFLRMDEFEYGAIVDRAIDIQQKVTKWTGIPISIGIGPTKTLAKVANRMAKKFKLPVFDLRDVDMQDEVLRELDVEEIWGVSSGLGRRLANLRIYKATHLRDAPQKLIRKAFSVVLERTALELKGISCTEIEKEKPKKNIRSSRSFGKTVSSLNDIEEAISNYAAKACEKLRKQHSQAKGIYVYVRTNHFKKQDIQYRSSKIIYFENPTSNTAEIISAAKRGLKSIYKAGYKYHKAGIVLIDLVQREFKQISLISNLNTSKSDKLMQTIDMLNCKVGTGKVFHASQGTVRGWQMKSEIKSRRYTTKWNEMLTVN